jgi:hypothetical protein
VFNVVAVSPSSIPGASVSHNGSGLLTVSGLSAGNQVRACATTTKSGYESAGTCFTGSASGLSAGLLPTFGSIQSQSQTGFAVQVTNYDASFTWVFNVVAVSPSSIPGASVSHNGSGLLTVSGLSAGNQVRVYATATKSGFQDGGNNTPILSASP